MAVAVARPAHNDQPRHSRTRPASSTAARSPPKAAPPRGRAASTSAPPFLTPPTPAPALPVASAAEETIGAFSPTSCPRMHLHHVLAAAPRPLRRRAARLRLDVAFAPAHEAPPPPPSPIPSICRTPSSEAAHAAECPSTAPSSAGPATPAHSPAPSPQVPHNVLRPGLAALEDASRFRVRTACAACARVGSNFPCCPRCGEMWCSRACRLQSAAGRRHVCSAAAA